MLTVVPMTLAQANAFIREHHRHSRAVPGAKFAIGVQNENGEICGVATVGRPTSPKIDQRIPAEITRVCTNGERNACSMLYAACRRAALAMGHTPIITYTLPAEGGASLRAAGFILEKKDAGGPSKNWRNRPRRTAIPIGDDLVGGKWRWIG